MRSDSVLDLYIDGSAQKLKQQTCKNIQAYKAHLSDFYITLDEASVLQNIFRNCYILSVTGAQINLNET